LDHRRHRLHLLDRAHDEHCPGQGRTALGFGLFAVFVPLIALIVVLIISPSNARINQPLE